MSHCAAATAGICFAAMKQPDDFHQRERANLIVMGIVIALVVVTVVMMVWLRDGLKREECFAAGHHTCAPIEEPR
jgi:cytochrome bd-type quinol oxidase subunit 2